MLEQWTGDDLKEVVKRCWKRREKTSGILSLGASEKGVATRCGPKLLDLGERDAVRTSSSWQPCLVCGRTPSDPHHIKFAEQRAMGRKVSDRFTVPICRLHHRELHRRGDEGAWWQRQRIDPLAIAATLWGKTHAIAPPANLAGNMDHAVNFNGKRVDVAVRMQNDETNPILRPEAE